MQLMYRQSILQRTMHITFGHVLLIFFSQLQMCVIVRARKIKLRMRRRAVDRLHLDAPSFLGEELQEPQLARLKDEVLSSDVVARNPKRSLTVTVSYLLSNINCM
jgi:hypothetical protein